MEKGALLIFGPGREDVHAGPDKIIITGPQLFQREITAIETAFSTETIENVIQKDPHMIDIAFRREEIQPRAFDKEIGERLQMRQPLFPGLYCGRIVGCQHTAMHKAEIRIGMIT